MNRTPDDLLERLKRHTGLGHAARDASFLRQVTLGMTSGGTSLAKAAGHSGSPMANLMSLYRFLDNDQIPLCALRETRARFVLESVSLGSEVLVVHDLTLLDYTHQNAKTDRRLIGDHGGAGYEYAAYALIDPCTGHFLGLVHDTLISAQGPDDQQSMDYDFDPTFASLGDQEKARLRANHRHQMVAHVRGLSRLLAGHRPIHVADREFDDIFILDRCTQQRHDFVIRSSAHRNVQVQRQDWIPAAALTGRQTGHPLPDGWVTVRLDRLLEALPLKPYQSLPLDERNRVVEAASAVRVAHLSIGACRVRLYRQAKRNNRYFHPPRPVEVNVVVICETHPPPDVEPLFWALFTSLPVETLPQCAYVAHLYELRWKIEQFFKLLKSGYRIEATRLDNATKTAKLLVLLSLAAMTVLALKAELGLPAAGRLSDSDYGRVKTALQRPEDPAIPLSLRLFGLIVRYGGWLARKNDPIGSTILMRGTLQVLTTLHALTHYAPLLHEAQQNPQLLRKVFRL